jgi:hypothetical protein
LSAVHPIQLQFEKLMISKLKGVGYGYLRERGKVFTHAKLQSIEIVWLMLLFRPRGKESKRGGFVF